MKKIIIRTCIVVFVLGATTYLHELFTLRPHWVYLYSLEHNGKVITVFYPKWYAWNEQLYIIPGKYVGTSVPETNYAKSYPHPEASLNVNWHPADGRELKIQFFLTGMKLEDHFDTTRYMIFDNGEDPGYMDKGDSFYSPKYRGFDHYEWIIYGPNDGSVSK